MVEIGVPEMRLRRTPEDFAYFYTVLGFALAIESTVIGMMTPLDFPKNIIVFLALALLTMSAFINCGFVHSRLIRFRIKVETKFR